MAWFGLSRLLIKLSKDRESIRSFLEVNDVGDNRAAAERLTQLGDVDGLILGLQNSPYGGYWICKGLEKLGDPSAVRPLCVFIEGMGKPRDPYILSGDSEILAAIYVVGALAYPGDSAAVMTLSWVVMRSDDIELQQAALNAAERIDLGSLPGALAANFRLEALSRLTDRGYGLDFLGRVLGHLRQEVSPADVVISADLSGLAAKRSNVITWTVANRGDGPAVGITVSLYSLDMAFNDEDDLLVLFEDVDLNALGGRRKFDMAFTPETAGDFRWNLDIDYWDVTGNVERERVERVRIADPDSDPRVLIQGDYLQGSIKQGDEGVAYIGGSASGLAGEAPAGAKFCDHCGLELSPDHRGRFCPHCGAGVSR